MTPDEADHRIILSRQMLARYAQMIASGQLPVHDLGLMHDELDLLERMADGRPTKIDRIRALGGEWLSVIAQIRAKLH
jgi:hypothetical protein